MDLAAENASSLLEWYRAMGVDETVAYEPCDWYHAPAWPAPIATMPGDATVLAPRGPLARSAPPRLPPQRDSEGAKATPGESTPVMEARETARSARSLTELRKLLESFEGCGLKKTANRLCLSRGSLEASVMFIGEAPGKDEDAKGQPFVGRAGQLLDRMLEAIALTEADVYITNLVFWRPPGNRTPTPEEVQVCQPFVERQIELLAPKLLVFLGNAAAKQLTGATDGIMKLRGKWLDYRGIKAMATLHPAYLLRNPLAKRLAWRDLLSISEALNGDGG